MAQVHIANVAVLNNPAKIQSPIQFEITFECFNDLPGTFDWRIIYLGSPTDSNYDQVIDEFDMTDIKSGCMTFNTDSNPPNFQKIPPNEIIGTTAILISVSYEHQEFFRVGYYIINEYEDPEAEMPQQPQLQKINRRIIAEKPRIMRFEIEWTKQQGNSDQNHEVLKKNLETIGGDPFQQSQGVFEQLEKLNYSYNMFGPGSQN